MLWEYIKAVVSASLEFAKGSEELIEIAIALAFWFTPKFFKQIEEDGIEYEKSVRKILWYKFITNDKWRAAVVLIGCLIFNVLVIAPYQVYKTVSDEMPKTEEKIVRWRPSQMAWNTPGVEVLFGGNYSGGIISGAQPQFFPLNSPTESKIQFSLWDQYHLQDKYQAIVAHIINQRLYLDLEIPTKTKPIEMRAGESTPLPPGWDWNYDANSFEIVDDQNQAVFQEIFIQTNCVWVRGAIQYGGQVLMTTDNGEIRNEPHGVFNVSDIGLYTKFEYSSSKFPGQPIQR